MSLHVVLMATGEFALPSLQAIAQSGHTLRALITQPDRLNPRGQPHPHPLKQYADELQLPVLQPPSINTPQAIRQLRALRADVVAVAAYGQILSAEVIDVPPCGMFNLHASLLPRHRGAAPVQYAVWKGDAETGVTIFQIVPKLDAGPMIVQRKTPIATGETAGQLHDRLAIIGADAFLEALELIEHGTAQPLNQQADQVTLAPKIRKEQGEINWAATRWQIDCHIRAMQPWPNPFTFLHRPDKPPERLLILETSVGPDRSIAGVIAGKLQVQQQQLQVACGDGWLTIETLQRAGKKPMSAAEFLRGTPLPETAFLGSETTPAS